MKPSAVVLTLALAGSACLAPADDAGETMSTGLEPVAETSAALTRNEPRLDPEASRWLAENIPKWSVYIGGKGRDLHPGKDPWNQFTNVYYDDPRDSDVFAPVILVRDGEENDPTKWVQLSLTQHWMKGGRYFDELVECGTLTMLDLLVIMGELAKHADSYIEPKPIRVLDAATPQVLRELRPPRRTTCKDQKRPRLHTFAGVEEWPHGPPPPPGWVEGPDAHTYGPGPMGPIAGSGHPLPPDVTSDRPSLSQIPPNPAPPRTAEQNGVTHADPKAKPSPYDKGYKPRSGEVKETFKCNGEVFYGYKAGCLDLSNVSLSMKWFVQAGLWLESVPEKLDPIRDAIQERVFRSGSKAQCISRCKWAGHLENGFVSAVVAVVLKSPAAGAIFGQALGGRIDDVVQEQCADQVCEGLR